MKKLFSPLMIVVLIATMLLPACHSKKNHPLDDELLEHLDFLKKLTNDDSQVSDYSVHLDYRVEVDTLILMVDFLKAHPEIIEEIKDTAIAHAYVVERLAEMDIIPLVYKNAMTIGMEISQNGEKPFVRYVLPFEETEYYNRLINEMLENDEVFGEGEQVELPFSEEDFSDLDWKASIKLIDDSVFGPVPLIIDEIQTLSRLETNGTEHLMYFDIVSDQLPSEEALEEMLIPVYKSQLSKQYGVVADKLCKAKVKFHVVLHSTILDQDIANFIVSSDELFH